MMPEATTSQQQATRAAIVAAVRAFCARVEKRARTHCRYDHCDTNRMGYQDALYAELYALERTVAADGETARE